MQLVTQLTLQSPLETTRTARFDAKTLHFAHTVHYVQLFYITLTINSDIPLYIAS
jgi:hypothetical protein